MARGGFPGMGGKNMNQMMNQMKKMQKEMEKMQEEMNEKEIEASSGGGAVTVKVNGQREVLDIKIDPEVVDPEDVEMLEDLVMTAVNEAMRQAEEQANRAVQQLTGGMNIPGL